MLYSLPKGENHCLFSHRTQIFSVQSHWNTPIKTGGWYWFYLTALNKHYRHREFIPNEIRNGIWILRKPEIQNGLLTIEGVWGGREGVGEFSKERTRGRMKQCKPTHQKDKKILSRPSWTHSNEGSKFKLTLQCIILSLPDLTKITKRNLHNLNDLVHEHTALDSVLVCGCAEQGSATDGEWGERRLSWTIRL